MQVITIALVCCRGPGHGAAGREGRGKRRLLKSDAHGRFILGENSLPMRLCQLSDSHGNLRYSLVPASDDSSGKDGSQQELIASSNIKVELAEEFVELGGTAGKSEQTDLASEESRYLGSLAHLCEVAIECFPCDTCTMKFPVESMLLRHKFRHRPNFRRRRRQLFACKKQYHSSQNVRGSFSDARSPHEPIYTCRLCSFRCDRRAILSSHLATKHPSARLEKEESAAPRTCYDWQSEAMKTSSRRQKSERGVVLVRRRKKEEARQVPQEKIQCCGDSVNDNDNGYGIVNDSDRDNDRDNNKDNDGDDVQSLHDDNTDEESESKEGLREEGGNYRCDACSFESSRKDKYQRHLRMHERRHESILSCGRCDFRCKSAATLDAHVARKHDANEQCQCNICDFKCAKKSTLYSHKRRHRIQDLGNVYSCNECGFKTEKKTSLYSHIKRKHKSSRSASGAAKAPEFFFCNQCEYKNKNKYELKVHVARKHTDDFKFSCDTCGKKFKVKGDLTNHIRFTHKEQPVICDVCGKTCLNSNSLYVHQKFAHYKAKYECAICKRRMVSQENLDEHMLRQHEKRENVVCEECGKTFSRNSRLKVHMRIHTGDKPYACTICSKSFARRTALKQHLLIHTGVRPYVCDICGKAFTQKPGLISHRKSHPGSHPPLPRVLIDHILNDVMNN